MKAEAGNAYRLEGTALRRWRMTWAAVAVLMVVPMLSSWVVYYNFIQPVCEGCLLTPSLASTLSEMGIDIRLWRAFRLLGTVLVGGGWVGVGILIFAFRSNDRRAVLMSILMLLVGPGFGGIPFELARVRPDWLLIIRSFIYLDIVGLMPLIVLFPNGKLAPRWSAWMVAYSLIVFFPNAFLYRSRFDFSTWDGLPVLLFIFIPLFSTVLLVPGYRYLKVFTASERQQTRWALLGFGLFIAAIIITTSSIPREVISTAASEEVRRAIIQSVGYSVGPLMIPVFIGVAILRSHLWDIDVIIRRTLVYGSLSMLLGVLYLGAVTILQSVFTAASGQSSPLAIVLSTLAIAALFHPLRGRIQGFIDRRFYRQKYNTEQALAQFASLAQRETNLDELGSQIVHLVQKTMQPERTSLWLRPTKAGTTGGPVRL